MPEGNVDSIRILVADDEPMIRDVLSRKLTSEGFYCIAAPDCERALKELEIYQFTLVLLDINMPGKSGIDILREIKVKYMDTAVIMITAVADVETAIKSMRLGAYDYIIKPIDLDMLMLSVERALEKRKLIVENRSYQFHLEDRVEEQTRVIRNSFLNSIKSLVYALEAKDKYTSGHSERMTKIAVAISQGLGLPPDKIEKIRLAGLLHDIGKIGLKESVLNKPGKLTEGEFRHVMSHCEIGARILAPTIEDQEILDMVAHHHEHYDGTGYPDGLMAEGIPQGARVLAVAGAYDALTSDAAVKTVGKLSQDAMVLAVADAYDAMTSDRPYRRRMSRREACGELEKAKNKQFDPVVVDIFVRLLGKGLKI